MKRALAATVVALLVGAGAPARSAEPLLVLRFATVAPDGSAWAHEFTRFARDVRTATQGRVFVRWYFGSIAGSELEVAERLRRGQLDGTAAGGMLCERAAPSWRATRIPGIYRSRAEAQYVVDHLHDVFQKEMKETGFVNLENPLLGPDVLLTRTPVHSFEELKHIRLWRWDLDEVGVGAFQAMGLHVVPLPLGQAGQAYDNHQIDGFVALPTAALAFQWSAHASYLINFQMSWLTSCFLMTERSWDRLTPDQQQVIRVAGHGLATRFDQVGQEQDSALLGGLFGRQGLKVMPASERLRSEFESAARLARPRLESLGLLPAGLYGRVVELLRQFRAARGRR